MGQELFVVTDLSGVWVVGDLYEQDFAAVGVESSASLMALAYPNLRRHGRVTYIDPRLDPQTRTARVLVEVPKHEGHLRIEPSERARELAGHWRHFPDGGAADIWRWVFFSP